MTTKDWRKLTGLVWINEKKNLSLNIGEGGEISKETSQFEFVKNKWVLNVSKNNKPIIGKIFKTKSQALRFAKAYMRTH